MTAPLLISLRDASTRVGLPLTTVWRAARLGQLATVRLHARARYYVRVEDLDAWIARHRQPARAATPPPPRAGAIPLTAPTLDELMPARRRFA
jgi:hypothetical protein